MHEPLTWLIIAVFYAPLHFVLPTLFVLLTGEEDEEGRRRLRRRTHVDCAVTMLVALPGCYALAQWSVTLAMLVLFLSMFVPYPLLAWRRRRA